MTEKLPPCPFCGATPHLNQGKGVRDQLHGELHQTWIVKCPHLCVRFEGGREEVITRWKTRYSPVLDADMIELITKEVVHNLTTSLSTIKGKKA